MLEIFDQNPQSRVFQVDRECYVVYLGSDWEDYKPFLRIGTSTQLPTALPPIVSSIIVPDVLTGNPLDEPASLAGDATGETHYIGDVETVEAMKKFVGQEAIPVSAIEEIDHEEDDGKHVLVYYYKDGNLKIKFRKNEIFDLRRREKLDGHFVARANDVKNQYGRGPFKLPGDAYQGHGFLVVDSTPYLIARGQLAALTLAPDYFFALCAAGIDADRLATVRNDDADAALIRFFKRSRTRNRAVHVVSARLDRVTDAASLFRENSLLPVRALPIDASSGRYEFQRFTVTEGGGRQIATLEGREGSLIIGPSAKSDVDSDLRIELSGSILADGGKRKFTLLEGALYLLSSTPVSRSVIESDFLPEKNYPFRDLLSAAENTLIGQLQFFFSELFAGRDAGKVLRTIRGLDLAKGRESAHPVVQILAHNYIEFASFIASREEKLASDADALAASLNRLQINRSSIPAMLPLVGEIFSESDRSYIFYRFAQRITSDRYAHAQQVSESISALPVFDYEGERQRLSDLISGLATPEQMDEARMRRIAESKKPTKKTPAPREKTDAADASPTTDEDRSGRSSRSRAGARGKSGRGSRGRGGWIIAAAALVLVALLLALLFTNVIPNPWFGGEETAIAGTGDDAPDGDSRGNGERGSPDDPEPGVAADGVDTDGGGTADTDGTDPGAAEVRDGTDEAPGGADDGSVQAGDAAAPTDPEVIPPGWEGSLPALRALDDEPGVIITDTQVIGPGGIEITLNDIILLVNQIATENGYDTMDEEDPLLPDPDWIFPGNVFVLPNATRYTVVQGDSIWVITVRYMVARLRQDYAQFTQLTAEYQRIDTGDGRKDEIVGLLRELAEESHSENFTALVDEQLSLWNE